MDKIRKGPSDEGPSIPVNFGSCLTGYAYLIAEAHMYCSKLIQIQFHLSRFLNRHQFSRKGVPFHELIDNNILPALLIKLYPIHNRIPFEQLFWNTMVGAIVSCVIQISVYTNLDGDVSAYAPRSI